jgi:N utilization substance protein B
MANRHLSRSIVLQTLFEWDFNGQKAADIKTDLTRNIGEFAPGLEDSSFIENLVETVVKKIKIIDEIITKAAPEWPVDKISVVDRNILRIGLTELLFGDRAEVPPKVAINEAIELAKTFGGENSGKFVNGVLGAVYKEMGEPGKDQVSRRKKIAFETDPAKMPLEKLGGAVIYSSHEKEKYLALVHDIFGYWTLSKGHIEEGIDEGEGTALEIKKELGIDIKIKDTLGENEYIATHPEKGKRRKHVYYFLGEAKHEELKLDKTGGGLNDAKWFKLSEIADLKIYDDILPIITKAISIIAK